jgi:hypothetical protein
MTTITSQHKAFPPASSTRRMRPAVLILAAVGVLLLLLALAAGWNRLHTTSAQPKAQAIQTLPFAGPGSVYSEQVPAAAAISPYVHAGSLYDQQVPRQAGSSSSRSAGGSVYNEQVAR